MATPVRRLMTTRSTTRQRTSPARSGAARERPARSAEGTAGGVAERSRLFDYPLTASTGAEHVAALAEALAQFGRTVRIGIEEMNELEDADTADILTEISRGVDKWLWFVEAHQQAL